MQLYIHFYIYTSSDHYSFYLIISLQFYYNHVMTMILTKLLTLTPEIRQLYLISILS